MCVFIQAQSALELLKGMEVYDPEKVPAEGEGIVVNGTRQPSNYRHVVVETEHPYLPATKQKWELEFPDDVKWIVVDFDSRSVTTQPEDRVSLYMDADMVRATCLRVLTMW